MVSADNPCPIPPRIKFNREVEKAYLEHPILGQRLREITQTALDLSETDPMKVFGWPDNMKFSSCMTLFAQVSGDDLFTKALEKFFGGQEDSMTLDLLNKKGFSL